MVDVVDRLDRDVLLQGHGVEAAHVADAGERGPQLREVLHGGAGSHELVVVQHRAAGDVDDGDDRAVEVAVGPRLGGALL